MSAILELVEGEVRWFDIEKGQFGYDRWPNPKWLSFWPEDSDAPLTASIKPQRNESGASWTLSGTREKPTLHPSVNAKRHWHGWLKDGEAKQ